jgi:hypothetical protein
LFVCALLSIPLSLASAFGQVFSLNAVGYYTVNVAPGWYMVANNLNYKDNRLDDVIPLPEWASGSEFHKFDARNQRYYEAAMYIAGMGWLFADDSDPTLRPGEGAFLRVLNNGAPAAITLTFVGDIAPRSCATIYTGWNQWSPSLGGDLAQTSPVDGDIVFVYENMNQQYRDAWMYLDGFGWLHPADPDPRGPRIPAGQSVFLWTSLTRNPCVWEVAPAMLATPGGVTLRNPTRSGSTFSFDFLSESGKTYYVQSSDAYPATWNSTSSPIPGNGNIITFTDSNAAGPARYYRLRIE